MSTLRALSLSSKWQVKHCVYLVRSNQGLIERKSVCKWSPLFAEKNDTETHTEATMNSVRSRDMQFNSRGIQSVDEDAVDTKHELSYDETGNVRDKDQIADSRMRIYESSNINLSSCMQSTVPQPFDGSKCGSDHVSPINMPGGSSGRDAKYISGNMQDTHQSRHFSTFVRKMQANKQNKTDSEFVVKGRFLEDSVEYQYGYDTVKRSRDFILSFSLLYIATTGLSYIVYSYLLYKEVPFERIVDVTRMAQFVSKMHFDDDFNGLTHLQMCTLFAKCHFRLRVAFCIILSGLVTRLMIMKNVRFYQPMKSLFKFDKWMQKKMKE